MASLFDELLEDFNDTIFWQFGETVTHRNRYGVDASRSVIFERELDPMGDYATTLVRVDSVLFRRDEGEVRVGETITDESGNVYKLTAQAESEDLRRVSVANAEDLYKFYILRVGE